jgi:hypothetical protein
MNAPLVGVPRLKNLYLRHLRRRRLNDLKDLVAWFLEERRDHLRSEELRIFKRLLEQRSFPGKAQDKELADTILEIESRS